MSHSERPEFDREAIERMLRQKPRRFQLSTADWTCLHDPKEEGGDWSLVFPFRETFGKAFESMCDVPHIGVREGNGRGYTFLKDPERLDEVREWVDEISPFVALRDCLPLSFALDYDREGGDPNRPRTRIGTLRSQAKPYDKAPTSAHTEAAKQLAAELANALGVLTCYEGIEAIVSMPPSNPDKPFDLPAVMTAELSRIIGVPYLATAVKTKTARQQLKNATFAQKLEILSDSVEIDADAVRGKTILLIDDLYQSGASMNAVGMILLGYGATAVYGLACEKTCRNDDNMGWPSDE